MSRRFDNRTKKEFISDIKKGHHNELILMNAYVDWLNSQIMDGQYRYYFVDNGVDNTGEFIENDEDVDMRCDFVLKRQTKRDKKIEIKYCKKYYDKFHLKINQVLEYVQNDVCVINFIGVENNGIAKFCILPPDELHSWLKAGKQIKFKPWGYKPCICLPVSEITFFDIDLSKYEKIL